MAGRGKPQKTKSLDESKTSQDKMKRLTLSKSVEQEFPKETLDDTAKGQRKTSSQRKPVDPTKANAKATKPKTSTAKEKSTQPSTEKTKTQPEAKRDTARTSSKASREKLLQQSSEETTEMKPEAAKIPQKASEKATKAKLCRSEALPQHQASEETTEMKTKALKDTKKASVKAAKTKLCSEATEIKPEAPELTEASKKASIKKKTEEVCSAQGCEDKALDSILHKTLEKLKIKQSEKSDTSEVVNKLIDDIIKHMKQNTIAFKEIKEPLRTGSYYEYLKISNPDEFDVMLPIPVDRVEIKPFRDDGAFYSVGLKRGRHPLQKFQEEDTLSASKVLTEFREEVKKCAKNHPEWTLDRKKPGCPAVTLTTEVQTVTISLDVVFCLEVKSSWPDVTNEGLQIKEWLGSKVRQEYRRKPYYLVPKYEGRGNVEDNGVLAKDVWRISLSHVEKDILKKHGSEKTCCEKAGERCCRKDCLKLLKHLLSQLKEKDPSLHKFCSYHAKTTLLHACCTRTKDTEWRASDLSQCFLLLLNDLVGHLKRGILENFFIPSQNLLSGLSKQKCNNLAAYIEEERRNGFPIFK